MRWWNQQQLKSKDAETRRQAVVKLADDGGDKAIESLCDALGDDHPPVRAAAVRGLAMTGFAELEMHVVRLQSDRDPAVREAVAEALKNCSTDTAREMLVSLLRDPAHGVRWKAAQSLEALKWHPTSPADAAWLATAQGDYETAANHGAAAVEALSAALKDGVYYKRQAALEALSQIGDARVTKPVMAALHDEDRNIRAKAIEALARIGDKSAVREMIRLLRDRDPYVRASAVTALGTMRDPGAVQSLTGLLKDPHWEVREAVARALGRFKDRSCVLPLAEALQDSDREVREAVVRALSEIGDPAAIEALAVTLIDEQESVRSLATTALRRLDREWERSPGAKAAIPKIKGALKHRDYWVRQAAAAAMARLGESRTVEPSLAHLLEPGQMRRQNATEILLRLLNDFDADLRQAAAEALGHIGDKNAIEPLIGTMRDGQRGVARAAAEALKALQWSPGNNDTGKTFRQLIA